MKIREKERERAMSKRKQHIIAMNKLQSRNVYYTTLALSMLSSERVAVPEAGDCSLSSNTKGRWLDEKWRLRLQGKKKKLLYPMKI